MTAPVFDVLDGGLLTTIQDGGRSDWAHLGVPESGAADPSSLAVANLLVGNEPGAAALEVTLVGPTLVVERRGGVTIGVGGADLGARIRGGRRLAPGRSHRLAAGDVVEIPGDDLRHAASGARTYLAIPGGIDVPVVLGSRSTCLAAGFGGLDGRALRAGDRLAAMSDGLLRSELVWPMPDPRGAVAGSEDAQSAPAPLRVLAGPEAEAAEALDALLAGEWRVSAASDRVGVRLDGEPLPAGLGGEATTHGVPWGAIQVPADGRPIVLGPDHQTTGGYRVVGVVICADLAVLGQLRPGAALRFVTTDRSAALAALRARRDALVAGSAAVREAAGWGVLTDSAGG